MVTCGRPASSPPVLHVAKEAIGEGELKVVEAADRSCTTLVSSGVVGHTGEVAVVDTDTGTICAPGTIGEIWVCGPSVAQGYWSKPEQTQQTFAGYLSSGSGPWLRTGDLGAMLNNQLYVTGRIKDVLIVRGLNHYPHDIELSVGSCHEELDPDRVAAFSVERGAREAIVVAAECHKRALREQVFEAVRRALVEGHDIAADEIVLIALGAVPRTSSGKLRRFAYRDAWLANTLPVWGRWQAPSISERSASSADPGNCSRRMLSIPPPLRFDYLLISLQRRTAKVLRAADWQRIEIHLPWPELGLDSSQRARLREELAQWTGLNLSAGILTDAPTIENLARRLTGLLADVAETAGPHSKSRNSRASSRGTHASGTHD